MKLLLTLAPVLMVIALALTNPARSEPVQEVGKYQPNWKSIDSRPLPQVRLIQMIHIMDTNPNHHSVAVVRSGQSGHLYPLWSLLGSILCVRMVLVLLVSTFLFMFPFNSETHRFKKAMSGPEATTGRGVYEEELSSRVHLSRLCQGSNVKAGFT